MSRADLNTDRCGSVAPMRGASGFARALALLALFAPAMAWVAFTARAAQADYQGPDENTSQAYGPLRGDFTYAATLQDGSDQDWYYFYVPAAGDQLHWTVSNTTPLTGCTLGPYACNVYATLEDSTGHQVGGGDSSAGTSGVMPSTTQKIDWTFDAPGKYYLAVVGDGGQLSYQFSVTPASGLSSTPPGDGGAGSSLHLSAHQRGRQVDVSLVVPSSGASLQAYLYTGTGRSMQTAGHTALAHFSRGTVHFTISLNSRAWSALKQHHRLTLTERIRLTLRSGKLVHASQKVVVTHR